MLSPLIIVPGLSVLLFTTLEMPKNIKKVFFNIPIWLSSSIIAIIIGTLARGVLGPMTGFVSELVLFPGLFFAKKHFHWNENRLRKKENKI